MIVNIDFDLSWPTRVFTFSNITTTDDNALALSIYNTVTNHYANLKAKEEAENLERRALWAAAETTPAGDFAQ